MLFLIGIALPCSSSSSALSQQSDTNQIVNGSASFERTTLGGYGEIHYSYDSKSRDASVDLTRFVVFLSHSFSHDITFNSEFEVEDAKVAGGEDGGRPEIRYSKGDNEMFVFMHNHILSLSLVFLAVGTIFYFSSTVDRKTESFLLMGPFAAIITTFRGIALVRYVSPMFSWLVMVSGLSLFACYAAIVILIVRELWFS